jgi:hypothetical protein
MPPDELKTKICKKANLKKECVYSMKNGKR